MITHFIRIVRDRTFANLYSFTKSVLQYWGPRVAVDNCPVWVFPSEDRCGVGERDRSVDVIGKITLRPLSFSAVTPSFTSYFVTFDKAYLDWRF